MLFSMGTLYFPLYFIAAWAMADRNLASGLRYHMPLSLRSGCPCIRYFWFSDLLFGSMSLPFVILGSQTAFGRLLSNYGQGHQDLWLIGYPISFVLMGLLWPKLSSIGISSKDGTPMSIAGLRDRFLGASKLQAINNHLQSEVETWVDRVIDSVRANPQTLETLIRRKFQPAWPAHSKPSEHNLDDLRNELLKQEDNDYEWLHESICQAEMIPFRDRVKPLMRVPEMTFEDEQILYNSGITTIRLLRSVADRPIGAVPAARLARLRNNARQLVVQRVKSTVTSASAVAAMLICIAVVSAKVNGNPTKPGTPEASPSAASVSELKNAYK
jgi:hypothetical protein